MAETWVLNEEPIFSEEYLNFDAVFTTDNIEMCRISIEYIPETPEIPGSPIRTIAYTQKALSGMVPNKYIVYDSSTRGWDKTAYRTLIFETAPTGDLLTWLQANGTRQYSSKKLTKLRYRTNQYGNIDLSTLVWSKEGMNFVSTPLSNVKIPASNVAANMICSKYRSVPIDKSFVEGDFAINGLGSLYVRDTKYSDIISFKESLKNLILTYELATNSSGGYLPLNKLIYRTNQYGNSVLTNSIYVNYKDSQKFFYIGSWSGATLYKRVDSSVIPKMGLLDYKVMRTNNLYDDTSVDKAVSLGYPGMYDNFIMVRDLSFNGDIEKFKQFIIGNNVWFELETPAQGGYLPLNKGVKL